MEYSHYSVLLKESVDLLEVKEDGIYVDATTGGGGHSSLILEKLKTGHLYCFDQDEYALKRSYDRLSQINNNFTLIHSNFSNLKEELQKLNISKIDGIIYDLGVSSFQLDIVERGFSYREDARLDMRMDQSQDFSAYNVINEYSYQDLVRIFFKYGEDPFSKQIASKICKVREIKPIETTFELVDVIKSALPQKVLKKKGHPAKLIFQAIRIEVNKELDVLEDSMKQALELLDVNGVCLVITFQPLEDKIVKHIFKEKSTVDIPLGLPMANIPEAPYKMVTRKPILPSNLELDENNRSHSAKLRVIKRTRI